MKKIILTLIGFYVVLISGFAGNSCKSSFKAYINNGNEVNFRVILPDSTDFKNANFYWEFGDGSVSTEASPGHVYEKTGVYPVTLTVSSRVDQCSYTYVDSIYIREAPARNDSSTSDNDSSNYDDSSRGDTTDYDDSRRDTTDYDDSSRTTDRSSEDSTNGVDSSRYQTTSPRDSRRYVDTLTTQTVDTCVDFTHYAIEDYSVRRNQCRVKWGLYDSLKGADYAIDARYSFERYGRHLVVLQLQCRNLKASATLKSTLDIEQPTDIQKAANANEIAVFPNPFNHKLNIQVGSTENVDVEIVDLTGQIRKTEKNISGHTVLNTSNLNSGVYMVLIKEGDQVIATEQVVK